MNTPTTQTRASTVKKNKVVFIYDSPTIVNMLNIHRTNLLQFTRAITGVRFFIIISFIPKRMPKSVKSFKIY